MENKENEFSFSPIFDPKRGQERGEENKRMPTAQIHLLPLDASAIGVRTYSTWEGFLTTARHTNCPPYNMRPILILSLHPIQNCDGPPLPSISGLHRWLAKGRATIIKIAISDNLGKNNEFIRNNIPLICEG